MEKILIKMHLVGRRLRSIRESISLSRQEIEQRHGISINSIKAWEMGIAEIGVIRLMSYLKIFEQYSVNISIDTLLQPTENYLDNIQTKNLLKPVSPPTSLISTKVNQDVELICNIFKKDIASLLDEKDTILKTLINNLPFKIGLKDENNNLILVNNNCAASLGGTSDELIGKNCYDLLPTMAKKYHEDDLKCINTNTNLMNIVEPYAPLNGTHHIVSSNKIPIINPKTNKKMLLFIAYNVA